MSTTLKAASVAPSPANGPDIADWRPEDEAFWESTGKKIAYRNLWISVPSLLCGFAIWGMWGIITVQMLNLGFPFTQADMFTLTAIAGISGATMRIPASFLLRLAGGLGGFVLPIMFGALMDFTGIRSSAFMLMYGVVWVSLIWMYWTEVRKTEVMGEHAPASPMAHAAHSLSPTAPLAGSLNWSKT